MQLMLLCLNFAQSKLKIYLSIRQRVLTGRHHIISWHNMGFMAIRIHQMPSPRRSRDIFLASLLHQLVNMIMPILQTDMPGDIRVSFFDKSITQTIPLSNPSKFVFLARSP
jgi:hypothetical protein